jgi:hypothetical protein
MQSHIAGYWRCVHPEFGAQVGKELYGRRGGTHPGRLTTCRACQRPTRRTWNAAQIN